MTDVMRRMRQLASDRMGAAAVEFALAAPILIAAGGYGVEIANYAIVQMRVSQVTLALADNASRIGVASDNSSFQLREGDIADILQGGRLIGTGIQLTTFGRVTITSLENVARSFSDATSDASPVLRLHWQRCMGLKGGTASSLYQYGSNYGSATPLTTAGTNTTYANRGPTVTGIGSSPVITAPSGFGTIFVETNYQYQPLFGTLFMNKAIIHYTASFIVRDKRDFSMIFNPATALGTTITPATCDRYTS